MFEKAISLELAQIANSINNKWLELILNESTVLKDLLIEYSPVGLAPTNGFTPTEFTLTENGSLTKKIAITELSNRPKLKHLLIQYIQAGGALTKKFTVKSLRDNPKEMTIAEIVYLICSLEREARFLESGGESVEPTNDLDKNLERCINLISASGFNWLVEKSIVHNPSVFMDGIVYRIFEKAINAKSLPCSIDELLSRAIRGASPKTVLVAIQNGANIRGTSSDGHTLMSRAFGNNIPTLSIPMIFNFNVPALRIMSILNDTAVNQFAEKISEIAKQIPKTNLIFLPLGLIRLISGYCGTDLFASPVIKTALILSTYRWPDFDDGYTQDDGDTQYGDAQYFDNRAIMMALNEGPRDLINLRNFHGETLLKLATKAHNTGLVIALKRLGAKA